MYTKEYLSKYGLSDVGLTPTEEDETAMQNGEVPPQLLADSCHFTLAKVIDTQFHLCYTFYITYETEVLTNDETTDVT